MADLSAEIIMEHTQAMAHLLDDHRTIDTVALDVRQVCSFADFFVIATVTSQGHLRGLMTVMDEFLRERNLVPLQPRRRSVEVGWVLIDLGFTVIHLMTEEMREFYELERLWFGAQNVFVTSST